MKTRLSQLIKVFTLTALFFIFVIIFPPQNIKASCDHDPSEGPFCGSKPADTCTTKNDGTSSGTAYYSEAYYIDCEGIGDGTGYYQHDWTCTTGCGTASSFMAGTIVSTPEGGKKIEDLKVGDRVISFADDVIMESVVSKTHKVRRDYYFDLVADGYRVRVTAKHPFYIGNDEFKIAEELTVGDNVYVLEKKSLVKKRVTSKTRIEKEADVYNLTIGGANTYFAGGFAVHNKGGGGYEGKLCDSGTSLICATPPITFCAKSRRGTCDLTFPSKIVPKACDDGGDCQSNCGCCAAGESFTCDGTVYEYTHVSKLKVKNKSGDLVLVDDLKCKGTDAYIKTIAGPFDCTGDPDTPTSCKYTSKCKPCACKADCTPTAPAAPTLNTPINNAKVNPPSVYLDWVGLSTNNDWGENCNGNTIKNYKVYLNEKTVPYTPPTSVIATIAKSANKTKYLYTAGVNGKTYWWRVGASNGTLETKSSGLGVGIRKFSISDNITGTVYNDTNNNCSKANPWTTGGVSVSLDSGGEHAIDSSDGTYDILASAGSHTVEVNIPAGYTCSTGSGCNSCLKTITSPFPPNNDFYLTTNRMSWWQAQGASVYAGSRNGVVVQALLPRTFDRLILAGAGTPGALLYGGGTVNLGSLGKVSDSLWMTKSIYRGVKMNYAYFARKYNVLPTSSQTGISSKPDFVAGKDFYYNKPVSGTARINSPWEVLASEKYTIFVEGNLKIKQNITVAQGGFLAFIVKGNVTIDPSVTSVQGLYVMNGSFVTQSNGTTDSQLVSQGSVVAWSGVSLERDLGDSNVDTPAEKFVYRVDLLVNMPALMKSFAMHWSEVAPGTY